MSRKKEHIKLTKKEREELEQYVKQGKKSARAINRARILLLSDAQKPEKEIIELLDISRGTIFNTRNRYKKEGLSEALKEKPRSGQPRKVDKVLDANITMIACSEAPDGRSKWTMRMIADKLVEMRLVDAISHVSVYKALKKTNSSPG